MSDNNTCDNKGVEYNRLEESVQQLAQRLNQRREKEKSAKKNPSD
jgi:hypothetical protein